MKVSTILIALTGFATTAIATAIPSVLESADTFNTTDFETDPDILFDSAGAKCDTRRCNDFYAKCKTVSLLP